MIAAILIGRKGSSGLPGKNTMELANRPMTWWPLDAARQTPEIEHIYVSTDDPEIVEVAQEFDATIIDRPQHLATQEALGDHAYLHAHTVIRDELSHQGKEPELYVLLMANAVTISPQLLSEGIQALRQDPSLHSAVTVSRYNMWSPLRARRITDEGILQPFVPFETFGDPATLDCDRDSQGDVWFADMGVSIVRPQNLDNLEGGLLPQKWMGQRIHPLKNDGGLDVDYPFQVPQAEWWVRQNRL
ncbi:cytidylyltransferase [Actinomycetota bacterium]|nr:cytidylyltransferase [Actinomycetota bacterium]